MNISPEHGYNLKYIGFLNMDETEMNMDNPILTFHLYVEELV